jgi:hypothetical protein
MKVRIKKSPSHYTGDQFDYSLVSHPTFSTYGTGEQGVKNTIGGVPREEANIEAEGGETIIGDLNNDGNIEHFTITGKRHSQGGVPMNVPPGSFIFSDTKKMRIKDRDVLDYFGMGGRSGGYTPAEISKRYKLNEFMQTVNSSNADPFAKRTAQDMLDKNMKKLAELAAYQEMMKGNQPPAVSQQILGSQEEMKNGGRVLPKAQTGISKGPDKSTGYWNRVANANVFQRENSDDIDPRMTEAFEKFLPFYGKEADGFGDWFLNLMTMPQKEINHLLTGYYESPMETVSRYNKISGTTRFWGDVATDPMMYPEIPYAIGKGVAKGTAKAFNYAVPIAKQYGQLAMQYGTQAANAVKHLIGKLPFESIVARIADISGRLSQASLHIQPDQSDVPAARPKNTVIPAAPSKTSVPAARPPAPKGMRTIYSPDGKAVQYPAKSSAPPGFMEEAQWLAAHPNSANSKPASKPNTPTTSKPKTKVEEQNFNSLQEALGSFMLGGETRDDIYEFGGYVFDPASGRMVKMVKMAEGGPNDPGEREVTLGIRTIKGKRAKVVRQGNIVKAIDEATGEVIDKTDYKSNINTYDPDEIKKLEEEGITINKAMDIDQLATTPGLQGARTDNDRVFGARNWAQGKEFEDFKTRHSGFFAANPNFDPTKKEDVKKFQKYYNEDIRRQAKEAGYDEKRTGELVNRFGFDETKESGAPNALDGDFGQYSWSRPTFSIKKKGEEAAGTTKPADVEGAKDFEEKARRDPGGMWIQNQNAIAMAAMDQPYYGAPSLMQVDMVGFNPQLEEYSAKNAMLQSNLASLNNQFAMTGDAATSRAAMLGAVGRANEQGAGIIENIQNRNVATTNQAGMANAEINNREAVANTELRKKFVDESTVYGQQLQNFFNNKMQRTSNAVNRGLAEMQNTNMVESMYPQFTIDRFTGNVVYDPTIGLRFHDDITAMNNSQNFSPDSYSSAARNYYESIKRNNPGISDDEAYKQAYRFLDQNMTVASRGQKGAGFMQAMQNSRMQQRYGGQTPEYAIGGPFFYDNFPF